jgi:hypothetical protein
VTGRTRKKTPEFCPKTAGKPETLEEDLKNEFGSISKNANLV